MTFKSKGYAPLVSFFILLIAAYLIYVTVRLPFVGVNVEKNRAGQWEISEVSAIGWANEVGIRPGDILVKVDDKPVSFHRPIQTFGVIGDAERLDDFEGRE